MSNDNQTLSSEVPNDATSARKRELATPSTLSRCTVDSTSKTSDMSLSGIATSGVDGISLTGCGILMHTDKISPDEYNTLFRNVLLLHKSSCWLLGDVLLLGDRQWGNRYTVSKYEEASEVTGLSRNTLRNIVTTCRRVPVERRHAGLSFTHHQEVAFTEADPEQQTAILEQAARDHLSCSALRKQLHQTRFTEEQDDELPKDTGEPCKLLDPENPFSLLNLPERSSPDAPPMWDALKFVDWVDKQDPEDYDLEQCRQALKLSETIAAYHEAVLARLKELEAPQDGGQPA